MIKDDKIKKGRGNKGRKLLKKNLAVLISLVMLMVYVVSGALWSQNATAGEINELYNQGLKHYKEKDFKGFLHSFQHLNKLRPGHPVILYNLAAGYSLNKKKEEAINTLRQLIYRDANEKIALDKDFDNIRNIDSFKEIVKQIEELRRPTGQSRVAFTITQRQLHPESVAYDPGNDKFYLSSVHMRKIVAVNKDGSTTDFTKQGQDGLDAVLGIRVDGKRRLLWATSTASNRMRGYKKEDEGRTGIYKYNLETGKLVKKYILQEGPGHVFDDVVVHPGGDAYISDNRQIYRIPAATDRLEPFISSDEFVSCQGIDFCCGGKKLLMADYKKGIYIIDLKEKKIETFIKSPLEIPLRGIDGMYYLESGNSIIAIQNGLSPARVMRFYLSDDLKKVVKAAIIERANPAFNEPTLGVVVREKARRVFYYIANSQWGGYNKDSTIKPYEQLQDIQVLKVPIDIQ
jgi:sugar lactone lactonase YvrE